MVGLLFLQVVLILIVLINSASPFELSLLVLIVIHVLSEDHLILHHVIIAITRIVAWPPAYLLLSATILLVKVIAARLLSAVLLADCICRAVQSCARCI